MRAAVFIGMSVDGFIARLDGTLDWLTEQGEDLGDHGFTAFLETVDALLMGRATYEFIKPYEEWPYGELSIHVLSSTLAADADPRIIVQPSWEAALAALSDCERVYVDGGQVVQTALREGLVDDITLTRVPVLIGEGIPLFGALPADVALEHVSTRVLAERAVQSTYRVA